MIEEEFRRKMFNPDLADEEVLIYAHEREKLLLNSLEYEAEMINNSYKLTKPNAYFTLRSSLRDINRQKINVMNNIMQLEEDKFYFHLEGVEYDEAEEVSLRKQFEKFKSLSLNAVKELMGKPVEVRDPIQSDIRKLNQPATNKYTEYLNSISLKL